jgi:dCMP deaminase
VQEPVDEQRESLDEYFTRMTSLVASRSTCTRRKVGAVLVVNKHVISTGYNGAPRGVTHCTPSTCIRTQMKIPSGTRQELCIGSHAEQNAIAQAASIGTPTEGATLYCTHKPCVYCAKLLINAGVKRVVYHETYGGTENELTDQVFTKAGVAVEQI